MKIELFTEGNISLPYKGITSESISSFLKKICKYLKLKNTILTIIICDNNYIRKINKEYRNKNKSTDVISFSYRENPFPAIETKSEVLGDIYLSLEKASSNAKLYNVSLIEEIKRLLLHGVLHLIGFDHERSKKDKKSMQEKEGEVIKAI